MVFWDVMCSVMNRYGYIRETSHVMVENGGTRVTENSINCLSNYVVLHPKKTIILFVCVCVCVLIINCQLMDFHKTCFNIMPLESTAVLCAV